MAALAASPNNLVEIKNQLKLQTIGYDKVNQLRHVRFFKDIHGMTEHMKKQANILRPKFEMILDKFDEEFVPRKIGHWIRPKGGYFICFEAMEGCAKAIVSKAKKAGVVLTPAGAPFPYGKDPKDSVIRIAPSYPTLEELSVATDVLISCVKLMTIDRLLYNMGEDTKTFGKGAAKN